MKAIVLMVCVSALLASQAFSQRVENIKATFSGEKVEVSYDLIAAKNGEKFDVALYATVNNYSAPLKSVSGDIGKDLLPGKGKKITWMPKEELGRYEGDVTFEVRAEVIPPPAPRAPAVEFTNPTEGIAFKKGRIYQIKWKGLEQPAGNIDLELLRNGVLQKSFKDIPATNDYSWLVPEDTRPGGNYQFKLETPNNQKSATSATFKITRKIPLVLKIAPIVVVGGVVAALAGGGGSGGGDNPKPSVDEPLPSPPDPPGN